jgi:hypothetical protein
VRATPSRVARRGRTLVGLGVLPGHDAGKTEDPTGGAHASVREGKENVEQAGPRDGPAREGNGPRERGFLGRGERVKEKPFHFIKQNKLFQSKFKHKDSNLN